MMPNEKQDEPLYMCQWCGKEMGPEFLTKSHSNYMDRVCPGWERQGAALLVEISKPISRTLR